MKRLLKRVIASSTLASRAYGVYGSLRWWRKRRRDPLSWTDEYLPVLSRIETEVPPRPFAAIEAAVADELGRPLADVFAEFEETPIACASLAQIHRARLRDGSLVAVKARHPGIAKGVRGDARWIGFALAALATFGRGLDLRPVVAEVRRAALAELDFTNEGRSAEAVAASFVGREDVIVPRVRWEQTTPRLLVSDFAEGVPAPDLAALDAVGVDRGALAALVTGVYLEQVFAHGVFQADPHPGNLLVQPGPRVALLDFGLSVRLSDACRLAIVRLARALIAGDDAGVHAACRETGFRARHEDRPAPFAALARAFLAAGFSPSGDVGAEARAALRTNPLTVVPAEFALLLRLLGLLGWLGGYLGRPVDWTEALRPYVESATAGTP